MAMQHISEPVRGVVTDLRALIMKGPPSYVAEGGMVVSRCSKRRQTVERAKTALSYLLDDALSCHPDLLDLDLKMVCDMVRAIRDAEGQGTDPTPPAADALKVAA